MPLNLLQAEGIAAMNQIAHGKGMPSGVRLKLGDISFPAHMKKQSKWGIKGKNLPSSISWLKPNGLFKI
jgi:hypothetical protein